jgi:hypothetical protein
LLIWTGSLWRDAGGVASSNHDAGSITSALQIPFGAKSQTFVTFASKENLNPLPIELTALNVNCDNKNAIISWQTASETNNDFFIVEKSNDMVNFFEVGRIDGAGNSNTPLFYSITDNQLFGGDNYYRLKQIDFDGRSWTSNIVSANCDRSTEDAILIAYPNPFTDELNVTIENLKDKEFVIEIIDDLGRIVYVKTYLNEDISFITTLDLSYLRPAVYTLRTKSESSILNIKVVKK